MSTFSLGIFSTPVSSVSSDMDFSSGLFNSSDEDDDVEDFLSLSSAGTDSCTLLIPGSLSYVPISTGYAFSVTVSVIRSSTYLSIAGWVSSLLSVSLSLDSEGLEVFRGTEISVSSLGVFCLSSKSAVRSDSATAIISSIFLSWSFVS